MSKPFGAMRAYRRRLPHFQAEGGTYFITFCTANGWTLPPVARSTTLEHCRALDGNMFLLHGVVVMPDHVHLILTPRRAGEMPYRLGQILRRIKGASARRINEMLARRGSVWQTESFDHLLRSDESAESKVDYMVQNPVRKGLAGTPEEYPWLWRRSTAGTDAESIPRHKRRLAGPQQIRLLWRRLQPAVMLLLGRTRDESRATKKKFVIYFSGIGRDR
jgi:putative transposase